MSKKAKKDKVKLTQWPRIICTGLVAAILSVILAPFLVLISLVTDASGIAYRISRFWSSAVARCAGIRFSLKGAEKVTPGASYIITPNHTSNSDILALLLQLPTPYRWVLKKELLRIPFFGWGLAATGCVSIDRRNRKEAVRSIRESVNKISGGWSLLIYPEGTRSEDGRLQRFKKGAFRLAVATGVPILPVTVNGAAKILPKHSLNLKPGTIEVIIGDPIPTEGLSDKDIPALMKRTWEAVEANLNLDYDPFTHDGKKSRLVPSDARSDG